MNFSVRPPARSFATRAGALRMRRYLHGRTMSSPPASPRSAELWVHGMTVAQLKALAWGCTPYRARAVVELALRARREDAAVTALGELSLLPPLQEGRLFHLVTLSWAAITALLAAETARSRHLAYARFADLGPDDQQALLLYLNAPTIEEAHPRL
ncbi:hypothetical protein GCM10020358_66660 [Amorphoplanes nipponensis]|uniref:Uncharacterized protein n=1 Tax=Actinoplanes nipponensis TaxID=135950 RepID=A0A919JM69_9ACTN|nr:hypothetical protein [Actinoplanes nipponensis]GIE51780.1 hypothetical protein Ani05nite_53140 [Actinoplanes nipponensis]